MAWIESHTVLLRHRKVLLAAIDLHIKPVVMIGHLHAFWHAVMEQQEDGNLEKWTDELIAHAACWEGDSSLFAEKLREHGWIDGHLVHDWLEHAGKYLMAKYRTSNLPRLHKIWATHGRIVTGIGEGNQDGWTYLRIKVLERDNYTCKYCGTKEGPFQADHVIPVKHGGVNTLDNLVCACAKCNRSKGSKILTKKPTTKVVLKSDLRQSTLPNLTSSSSLLLKKEEFEEEERTPPPPLQGGAATTFEKVVEHWNAIPGVSRCAGKPTGFISERIRRQLLLHPDWDWWVGYFREIASSDFLCGRTSDFQATLDWVLGPKNMAKVANGNYRNKSSPTSARTNVTAVCQARVQQGLQLKPCGHPATTVIGKRPVCAAHKEEHDARQKVDPAPAGSRDGTGGLGRVVAGAHV